jgi:hypothetical protein
MPVLARASSDLPDRPTSGLCTMQQIMPALITAERKDESLNVVMTAIWGLVMRNGRPCPAISAYTLCLLSKGGTKVENNTNFLPHVTISSRAQAGLEPRNKSRRSGGRPQCLLTQVLIWNVRWSVIQSDAFLWPHLSGTLALLMKGNNPFRFWGSHSGGYEDILSCSLLSVNQRFGGTYRLHLRVIIISSARNQLESRWHEVYETLHKPNTHVTICIVPHNIRVRIYAALNLIYNIEVFIRCKVLKQWDTGFESLLGQAYISWSCVIFWFGNDSNKSKFDLGGH